MGAAAVSGQVHGGGQAENSFTFRTQAKQNITLITTIFIKPPSTAFILYQEHLVQMRLSFVVYV